MCRVGQGFKLQFKSILTAQVSGNLKKMELESIQICKITLKKFFIGVQLLYKQNITLRIKRKANLNKYSVNDFLCLDHSPL